MSTPAYITDTCDISNPSNLAPKPEYQIINILTISILFLQLAEKCLATLK